MLHIWKWTIDLTNRSLFFASEERWADTKFLGNSNIDAMKFFYLSVQNLRWIKKKLSHFVLREYTALEAESDLVGYVKNN